MSDLVKELHVRVFGEKTKSAIVAHLDHLGKEQRKAYSDACRVSGTGTADSGSEDEEER